MYLCCKKFVPNTTHLHRYLDVTKEYEKEVKEFENILGKLKGCVISGEKISEKTQTGYPDLPLTKGKYFGQ